MTKTRAEQIEEVKRLVDAYVDAWIAKNNGPEWSQRVGTTKAALTAAIDALAAEPQAPADDVLEALDLSPEAFRTEGGTVNKGKLRAAILHPQEYLPPGHWLTAPRAVTEEMVSRFLGWKLPKTFSPDCGISFDGRGPDAAGYEKTWPIGTNLLTAIEARAMLEHVLRAAPTAEPVAWLNPSEPADCITTQRKRDWEQHHGAGGRLKASGYTVPLYAAAPKQEDKT